MGGNLFTCRRYTTEEMVPVVCKVGNTLSYFQVKWSTIPYLAAKQDHGDLDIIVSRQSISNEFLRYIEETFDYRVNGKECGMKEPQNIDVLSFLHEELQVDLIAIDEESCDFAVNYHAYNDLGGIIGSSLRPIGVKVGREGFYYEYEALPNTGNQRVYLTKNFKKFLDAVELSDHIYYGGKTLADVSDMIDYLKDWKFFNVEYIDPENMNATRKNRARKRKNFVAFTEEARRRGLSSNYHKGDYDINYFVAMFDHDYISDQLEAIEERAFNIVQKRYMFSLQRMEKVLGYSPDDHGEIFRIFSETYPNPKEVASNMTDSEFKDALEEIIVKIQESYL